MPADLDDLTATVARMLDEEPSALGPDDDLMLDWGLDSVLVIGFVEQLAADGIEITLLELAEQPTLRAWERLIADRRM